MEKNFELAGDFEAKMLLAVMINESIEQLGLLIHHGYVSKDFKYTGKSLNRKVSNNSCLSLYKTVGELESLLTFFKSGLAEEYMGVVLPGVSIYSMLEKIKANAEKP